MNEIICAIDSDTKMVEAINLATQPLCKILNVNFLHKSSLSDLNKYLAESENKNKNLLVLILSSDSLPQINAEELLRVQKTYNTSLIITAFDDVLNPLKKIETWPVDNIIYKPFNL